MFEDDPQTMYSTRACFVLVELHIVVADVGGGETEYNSLSLPLIAKAYRLRWNCLANNKYMDHRDSLFKRSISVECE